MVVRESVPVSSLTTFAVGGRARFVVDIESTDDLRSALAFAHEHNAPVAVLGEGSNILPSDEDYGGVLLIMRTKGIETNTQGEYEEVTVAAGESWDEFVTYVASQGLWGVENLAGIPGTVGASPVQNIGAYGSDISQVLVRASVYNAHTGELEVYEKERMELSYRDSLFKHAPELIVTSVTFRLSTAPNPRLDYPDLRKAREEGVVLETPIDIARAVRQIRSKKFPDLREFGTAGSFFKNPVITHEAFARLSERFGALPSFPQGSDVKIPLAFILDKLLGLRGHEKGNVFLFGNQPLVIVAKRNARAEEIESIAKEIEEKVFVLTGIHIEREVRKISEHEIKNS